jgi:CubicO group peptidase (beta-lactamase class C family)
MSVARLERMHDSLSRHVESGELPGLVALVSRAGDVHIDTIGAHAFGDGSPPMRRDTIFRIASMTKPVVAAAALMLVEACKVRLDDPVERFLPELANRRVLKKLDGPVGETVRAKRAITLRDLFTLTMGFGLVFAPPGKFPIQRAMANAGLVPGPNPSPLTPDEWMERLGRLPLMDHPGEGWRYHTGSDVLGVLVARVSGQALPVFLRERIFEPLGMKDTGFHVPESKRERLPTSYTRNVETNALEVHDEPSASRWGEPPTFPSGGGGLVSTVDDYHAFCRMLLAKGRHGRDRILSRPSVELMTSDQLTPHQLKAAHAFLGPNRSWGFGLGIVTRRDDLYATPGRFGWDGGCGTSAWSDPAEDLVGVLMTQRLMDSPRPPAAFTDFWTSTYQAIYD